MRVAHSELYLQYLPVYSDLLNSWKEIADYLGRGVRTAQRWEVELHLPVRRPHQRSRSSVTALKSDLNQWVRKSGRSANGSTVTRVDIRKATSILKIHRQEMRTLTMQVHYQMQQTRWLLERACELASRKEKTEPAPDQGPAAARRQSNTH